MTSVLWYDVLSLGWWCFDSKARQSSWCLEKAFMMTYCSSNPTPTYLFYSRLDAPHRLFILHILQLSHQSIIQSFTLSTSIFSQFASKSYKSAKMSSNVDQQLHENHERFHEGKENSHQALDSSKICPTLEV